MSTYLVARRVPERLASLAVLALAGAALARTPTPTLQVDFTAQSYPAVLVAAAAPVLIGVLAAVTVATRLGWLVQERSARACVLRLGEFTTVTLAAAAAAAICGARAEMVGVAVQNALVTQFATSVLALAIPGAAPALLTGAAATTLLLSSPGVENSVWVVSDGVADSADWIVVAALAPLAALSATIGGRWRPSTHGRLLIGDGRRRVARARR